MRFILLLLGTLSLLPTMGGQAGSAGFQYDGGDRLVSVSYSASLDLSYTYDAAGNITSITAKGYPAGNINRDGRLDLKDAILILQLLSGMNAAEADVCRDCAVSDDGKISLSGVIYTLQAIAELRTPF